MTCRIDQVKINVLEKGLNMEGHFCHFLKKGSKIATL